MSRKLLISTVLIIISATGILLLGQGTAQVVPPPAATPGVIVVNNLTPVTFTVNLSGNPSIIATSVNLIRLSSTGTQTVVATMTDDGTSGDAVAGDKIFTVILNITESLPGTFGFQVSVALTGQLRRVLSGVLQFATLSQTSSPVFLPPDPGAAGKTTVAGVDSDGDGIRDDVQRYIIFTYPQSERKRAALNQAAKALQEETITGGDGNLVHDAYDCISAIFMSSASDVSGGRAAYNADRSLEAVQLNTAARVSADSQADAAAAIVPSTPYVALKSHCLFNPSTLLN